MRASSERQRLDELLQAIEKGPNRLKGVAAVWVRDCWFESIVVANKRKRFNRRFHLICRYVTYTGALVLPILSGLTAVEPDSPVRVWTFAVSLVVAVAAGALQVFKFGQQWRIHEEFGADMEAEGWSYFQSLGVYRQRSDEPVDRDAGPDAYAVFFERVEALRRRRGAQFIREVGAEVANLEGTNGGAYGDSQPLKDPSGKQGAGREAQPRVGTAAPSDVRSGRGWLASSDVAPPASHRTSSRDVL